VLLLHELTGATAETLRFADELSSWGYHVFLPNLYDGSGIEFGENRLLPAFAYIEQSRDWTPRSRDSLGRIEEQIACIVEDIRRNTGRRVAVIGNCLTGILPFSLISNEAVSVGIMAQPATPMRGIFITPSKNWGNEIGMSDEKIKRSITSLRLDPSKRLAGFHFSHDPIAPMARFDEIHTILKDVQLDQRFECFILHPESEPKRYWWTEAETARATKTRIKPHSTLTHAEFDRDRFWFRARLREFLMLHHH